jgi:small subunit ribosomal protein S16
MLTIRLSRFGKKKHPIYRVIISEKQKDTVGDYLELLGHYDPHTNKAELKADRIKYWIDKGAQTSGTVHNLLVGEKIITGEKIKVANIKKKSAEGGSTSGGKEEGEGEKNKTEEKKEESKKKDVEKPTPVKKGEKPASEEKKENKPTDEVKKEETTAPEQEKK